MVDKFPYLHESLAWIFSLLEWVAKSWPNHAKQPNIVDGMPNVIEKMKEKSVKEIAHFVEHLKNNHFVHGEYPNTKTMTFTTILANVLNKVKFVLDLQYCE
jgi:hypothetical protein